MKKISNKLFDLWESNPIVINFSFYLLILLFYSINSFLNFISDSKESTKSLEFIYQLPEGIANLIDIVIKTSGNIIGFSSALITLNGVFLTLLVTLKESPLFGTLKRKFPDLHDYLYTGLKSQLYSCVKLILVCIVISWFGNIKNIFFAVVILTILGYYISSVTIGALYNIKVVTDLTTKEFNGGEKPLS